MQTLLGNDSIEHMQSCAFAYSIIAYLNYFMSCRFQNVTFSYPSLRKFQDIYTRTRFSMKMHETEFVHTSMRNCLNMQYQYCYHGNATTLVLGKIFYESRYIFWDNKLYSCFRMLKNFYKVKVSQNLFKSNLLPFCLNARRCLWRCGTFVT